MAKRKKLTAPSAEELKSIEEGFAAKPNPVGPKLGPPIAQVAAEAAALTPTQTAQMRAEAARDSRDAERFRQAEAEGLVIIEIPTDQIAAEELTRDRMVMDAEDMRELKASITLSGLRLPIEVFDLDGGEGGPRYGLLSGFRRLSAVRQLEAETAENRFATIRAILRRPDSIAQAYMSMVEENEVRASLTPYERGRVAVLAVGQGAYDSVEAAVAGLFHAASKGKRSKIRSFALVHEELGDMLTFPEGLSERAGLRLANAVRAGLAGRLREALATGHGVDPDAEWHLLDPIIAIAEAQTAEPKKRGRPRQQGNVSYDAPSVQRLENGITIRRETDTKGHYIRIEGRQVDAEMIDTVMFEIRRLLEPP